jgi:hypothetical protein
MVTDSPPGRSQTCSREFSAINNQASAGLKVDGAVQHSPVTADGWKAVLAISVTMQDLNEPEITRRVIFEKLSAGGIYAGTESHGPGPRHDPAMEIISVTYQSLQGRRSPSCR